MNFIPDSLRALPRDAVVLFVTRFTRLFAYGALSVILVFYLVSLGLTEAQVGILLTLTLAGDIAISLLLTTISRLRRSCCSFDSASAKWMYLPGSPIRWP